MTTAMRLLPVWVIGLAMTGAWGGTAVSAESGSLSGGMPADSADWPAAIARLNPFRLRSLPPPPTLPQETERAARPVIVLRGVADVTGRKLACVESRRTDGSMLRALVTEGQAFAGVEVTSIDVNSARTGFRGLGEVWEVELSPGESKTAAISPPHPGQSGMPTRATRLVR